MELEGQDGIQVLDWQITSLIKIGIINLILKASQKRGFHFSRKLKVDQEFLRSSRHSRLKELNGQRQVGRKVRHWFGDGHPAESGSHAAAYVADMDYSIGHFPNLVLGHCLPGW